MDFSQECASLYDHVLLNYEFALLNQRSLSLLDCPASGLVACFLNAVKQGLSITNSHPSYNLKCVKSYSGESLCTISYTEKGLTQLLGYLGIAKAIYKDVIYENDNWAIMGPNKRVEHKVTTFDKTARGDIACVYATAVFYDDSCLTMSVPDLDLKTNKDCSKETSKNSVKLGIWEDVYACEMIKENPIFQLWKNLQNQITRLRKKDLIDNSAFEIALSIIAAVEYDSSTGKPTTHTVN